jgi:hypothetical protein
MSTSAPQADLDELPRAHVKRIIKTKLVELMPAASAFYCHYFTPTQFHYMARLPRAVCGCFCLSTPMLFGIGSLFACSIIFLLSPANNQDTQCPAFHSVFVITFIDDCVPL